MFNLTKLGGQGPNQPGGGGGGDHQGQAVISAVGGAEGGVSDEDRYSRKVFVGGLPPDIDEDEITASFRQYGPLCVDWPHKNESKSYFPPKVAHLIIVVEIITKFKRAMPFSFFKTKSASIN